MHIMTKNEKIAACQDALAAFGNLLHPATAHELDAVHEAAYATRDERWEDAQVSFRSAVRNLVQFADTEAQWDAVRDLVQAAGSCDPAI